MIMDKEKQQEINDIFFTLSHNLLLFNENSPRLEIYQNKRPVHYYSLQYIFVYKSCLRDYLWSHIVFY